MFCGLLKASGVFDVTVQYCQAEKENLSNMSLFSLSLANKSFNDYVDNLCRCGQRGGLVA